MAHHKRKRPKSGRSGCLMCKPHKRQGAKRNRLPNMRFGQIRRYYMIGDKSFAVLDAEEGTRIWMWD